MRKTKTLTAMVSAVLLGLAGAGACGGSKAASPSAQPDAEAVCPATPDETIGAVCAVAGLRCGPLYTCGVNQASLSCVCTGGVFHCTDGAGNRLDAGAVPACPPPARAGSCPSTERGARFASCSDQGLLCAYPSACPSRFDQCQCFPGATTDGGFGLRFECTPAACSGFDAGVIALDSGGSDSVAASDSGHVLDADADADSETDSNTDAVSDGSSSNDAPAGDTRLE
jgi:hypothetical protein